MRKEKTKKQEGREKRQSRRKRKMGQGRGDERKNGNEPIYLQLNTPYLLV